MSDTEPKAWTWDIADIPTDTRQLKALLKSRNCTNVKGSVKELQQRLTENYDIDDPNMKPLNELSLNQLKYELMLRDLSIKSATKRQDLIDRLTLHPMPSISTLLVYGYIRENETTLENNQFIPFYLKEFIISYYTSFTIIYYLNPQHPNQILITNINKTNRKWKANIIELNKEIKSTNTITSHESKTYINCSTIHSLILPPKISSLIQSHCKYNNNIFHMIFKICGQYGENNCVLLINESEFQNKNEMIAFKWNIPTDYGWRMTSNCVCFDEDYGLLAYSSGVGYRMCSLSFKSNQFLQQMDWKWKTIHRNASSFGNYPSCVVIKTNENKKLFFVTGNDWHKNKTHFFDFVNNKWKETIKMKKMASKAGICYDNMKQKIFVGGGCGYDALSRVQCFDLNKEVWSILPYTVMEHENYPILWNDKNHSDLLFIGSIYQNGLEYIDLRMNNVNKRWKVVYVANNTQNLATVFGTNFANPMTNSQWQQPKAYLQSRLCITQI